MKKFDRNLLASVGVSFALMAGAHASNTNADDADADAAKQVSVVQEAPEEGREEVAQEPVAAVAPVTRVPQTRFGYALSYLVGSRAVCAVGDKLGYDYTPKKEATFEEKLASCKSFVELFDGNFDEIPVSEHQSLVIAYDIGNLYPYYQQMMERKNGSQVRVDNLKERTDSRRLAREARQSSSSDEVNE